MKRWRLLPCARLRAFENMARDEAVFLQSLRRPTPTIRFYSWLTPAVSVGYFQQIEGDVDLAACVGRGVDIVRRPTGGKAVFHAHDWTYAVAGRAGQNGFPDDILGTYRILSRCLIAGLRELGIEAGMAEEGRPAPDTPVGASCFSAPSRYELLVNGRKICGSAQVRSRGSFLQHGSLLLDFDPSRTAELLLAGRGERERSIDHLRRSVTSLRQEGVTPPDMATLCGVMKRAFESELDIELAEESMTPQEEALANRLLREKYADDEWNLKASSAACRRPRIRKEVPITSFI